MAALATTTLNGAVSTQATRVCLTSTADLTTVGMYLFVDGEAMQTLAAPDGNGNVPVMRGVSGTRAIPHATADTVYIGTSAQFYLQDPWGVPPTWPDVTPWINLTTGGVWNSVGGAWTLTGGSGTGTGTGLEVFQTSPTLITPTLGAATATTLNKITFTAPSSTATLTLITGSSLITAGAFAVTLTSTGTTNVTLPTSGTLLASGGDLGTPSAGVATNLTGTAAGLTAGTVTTNANLTGPITSTGNGTAIASQTGTGTKFVVDTSPTLVTPVLGVASGTSVDLSGDCKAATFHVGATAGADGGPFTTITGITVVKGIITAIAGT